MTWLERLEGAELHAQNFKSFASERQGFSSFATTNVVVGRNNSGKSALLDIVSMACGNVAITPGAQNRSGDPKIICALPLKPAHLQNYFRQGTSGGHISGDHWTYGKRFVGSTIWIDVTPGKTKGFLGIDATVDGKHIERIFADIPKGIQTPFEGKHFRRLVADRDIRPEGDGTTMEILPNGAGFTNLVQRFINKSTLPSDLVERSFLSALNEVFQPDAGFSNIRVRQHENNSWEVYLEEVEKGAIALSNSGSGLKTVLLVLGFLVLIPHLTSTKLSEFVFAFEELENNLHPALQRRLVSYIHETAKKNDCLIFLTTHSSAIIDMLSHDSDAQIVHVTHDGKSAKVRKVATYVDNRGILDDLDVRASDLLQSNGIVWVEGPSDRLYFNRWIELISEGRLREGSHYQCVFYGGRLLAHLSGGEPFSGIDQEDAVKIFHVNRNAIILIDSDMSAADSEINSTKKRVSEEVSALGGLAWISKGREIENYIPDSVLQKKYGNSETLGEYEDIGEYLERVKIGEGKRFQRNKILFAEEMLPLIQDDDLKHMDLLERLTDAASRIAKWNGLAAI